MRHKYENLIRYGLIPLTAVLSILYLSNGFRSALLLPGGSGDLRGRYQEQLHILKRINPNYVYEWKRGYPKAKAVIVDPPIRLSPGMGGYPPWAYFTGLFLVPGLPWPVTKLFFSILNAFSLGIMTWFTYRVTVCHGRLPAVGLAMSVLAMGSNSFTLGSGQYGIIINALIAGMARFLSVNRPTCGGLLYGISLVKPSIAAPFFFILGVKRQWLAITATVLYIFTASLAIWAITGTDPVTMFIQFIDIHRAGGVIGGSGYGPANIVTALGVSKKIALITTAIGTLCVGFIVLWRFRDSSLIVLLGTASVFGYLWTAHRSYDDVMMAFLLIAIGDLALRESKISSYVVFGLLAFTLWLPPSIAATTYVGYTKLVIWVFSLCYLLFKNRENRRVGEITG